MRISDDAAIDGGDFGGLMAGSPGLAQQQTGDGTFTMKVQTDIVLTNVVVRDKKTGEVVKGLKAERLYDSGEWEAAEDCELRLPECG